MNHTQPNTQLCDFVMFMYGFVPDDDDNMPKK